MGFRCFPVPVACLLGACLLLAAARPAAGQHVVPGPDRSGHRPAVHAAPLPPSAFLSVPPRTVAPPDSSAASDTAVPSSTNYRRLAVVGIPVVASGVGTYVYLQHTWWDEEVTRFHFDWSKELRYAKNLDKMGHLLGGYVTASLMYDALRWSHTPHRRARWWAAGVASSSQLIVEIKDGFAERWGFGVLDVASGTLGSLYPLAQDRVPFLADTDLKFSYWRRTDAYFENYEEGTWHDDYVNQTYWLSHDVDARLPAAVEPYWPDFLNVAVGLSVEDLNANNDPVYYELILALDVDLVDLLPDGGPFWERTKHYLNVARLPAPALRLTPSVKGFALYW